MRRVTCLAVAGALLALHAWTARAGGGPANVLVVYNADDAGAVEVAQAYRAARSIPEGQLCGLTGVDPGAREMAFADVESLILDPVRACLAALPQPEEIDVMVTVRGLPYRVELPDDGYVVGLEALLQVLGAVSTADGTPLAGQPQLIGDYAQASIDNPVYIDGWCREGDLALSNPYDGWYEAGCEIVHSEELPRAFVSADAGIASGYDFGGALYVVTRLDGFDHDDALDLVDRGVAGDGTFPAADILCMEGADEARAARDPECEMVARHLDLAAWPGVWVSPHDAALTGMEVAAYFTGASDLRDAIDGQTFVPGAIACNLTSYGAVPDNFFCDDGGTVCPESESQTSIARFVRAGATGVHGTVAEPLNNVFPNAGTLLLYTSGYSLGESFLLNQRYLYWVNLVLGDPLAAPYAERPLVELQPAAEVPEGGTLTVTATHTDGVAEIRLYVGGVAVAAADGDELAWPVDGVEGDALEVLAVAVAANAQVDRPGWPVETQLPRPDVQGWTAATLVVGPPSAGDDDDDTAADDDDDADDDAPDDDGGGCSCGHAGHPPRSPAAGSAALLLAGMAMLAHRRRRGRRVEPNGGRDR